MGEVLDCTRKKENGQNPYAMKVVNTSHETGGHFQGIKPSLTCLLTHSMLKIVLSSISDQMETPNQIYNHQAYDLNTGKLTIFTYSLGLHDIHVYTFFPTVKVH